MGHLIKKQFIELAISSEVNAFSLQHEVSQSYWNAIVPELEKIFDRIAGGDDIIEIDKLEIDAGVFNIDQIAHNQWVTVIGERIFRVLEEMIRSRSTEKSIRFTCRGVAGFQQWIYYMQKGYLPWNCTKRGEEWHQQVFETLATDYNSVAELRRLILTNADVRDRIVYQYSEVFLEKLVAILTATNQHGLIGTVNDLTEVFFFIERDKTPSRPELRKEINQSLYRSALVLASGNEKLAPAEFAKAICALWINDAAIVLKRLDRFGVRRNTVMEIIEKLANKKASRDHRLQNGRRPLDKNVMPISADNLPQKYSPVQEDTVMDDKTGIDTSSIVKAEALFEKQQIRETAPIKKSVPEEGIFVSHAGIVMLHCFLQPLLNYIGLITDNEFADDNNRIKALYLLHYLATGNETAEEHELLIPKILCSYGIDMPVPFIALSEKEKEEADNLLTEVIAQWKRPISAGILREWFLQRGGKFFVKNETWNLLVETNTFDVMLSTLPWGMGVVKLPWMEKILMVDWGGER